MAVATAITVPASPARADTGCEGSGPSDQYHGYSQVFTTCGNANAVSAVYQTNGGVYHYASVQGDHVNADVQIVQQFNPVQEVEVGLWAGYHVYCNDTCATVCFYGAQQNMGGYGDTCAVQLSGSGTSTQGPNTFHIEYTGGTAWVAKVDVTTIFTSTGQGPTTNRPSVGMEEGALSFPSPQYSPKTHFTQIKYSPANGNVISYQPWGSYSGCFVDYAKDEGFVSDTFPTAFYGAIAKIGGPPPTCSGAVVNTPRSSWQ